MGLKPIDLTNYRRIMILTGAGVSAASGITPFRGTNGLWLDPSAEKNAHLETWQKDPLRVWQFWQTAARQIQTAVPSHSHLLLSRLESLLSPAQSFLLATQNIDGLHQKAGSRNVVEIHGNLARAKCSQCDYQTNAVSELFATVAEQKLPLCPNCQSLLRPDLVFFGEELPIHELWLCKKTLRDCDLFLALGTSGTVDPAANFVRGAAYVGARTIYLNLDPMPTANPYFQENYFGELDDLLPKLFPAAV